MEHSYYPPPELAIPPTNHAIHSPQGFFSLSFCHLTSKNPFMGKLVSCFLLPWFRFLFHLLPAGVKPLQLQNINCDWSAQPTACFLVVLCQKPYWKSIHEVCLLDWKVWAVSWQPARTWIQSNFQSVVFSFYWCEFFCPRWPILSFSMLLWQLTGFHQSPENGIFWKSLTFTW